MLRHPKKIHKLKSLSLQWSAGKVVICYGELSVIFRALHLTHSFEFILVFTFYDSRRRKVSPASCRLLRTSLSHHCSSHIRKHCSITIFVYRINFKANRARLQPVPKNLLAAAMSHARKRVCHSDVFWTLAAAALLNNAIVHRERSFSRNACTLRFYVNAI